MRQAAKDLAYGCGGTPAVLEVWETARNRQFQMSERPVTLMGCHFEVIRKDTQTMMQRATQVDATLQNKRLYMFTDVAAEKDFLPSELNANRSYGYERQVFVLEEKVLVVANDKRKEYQSRFSNGDYAQNAMVGSVTEFADPFYEDGQLYYGAIWVQVEGRPVGAQMLRVLLAQHEAKVMRKRAKAGDPQQRVGEIRVRSRCYAVRPYWDRTLDYAQGLQWPLVQVDATRFWDYNMFYMAVTRCESLAGLKIVGVGSEQELIDKARVHFKSIIFMHDHGGNVPADALRWANERMQEHLLQWGVAQLC